MGRKGWRLNNSLGLLGTFVTVRKSGINLTFCLHAVKNLRLLVLSETETVTLAYIASTRDFKQITTATSPTAVVDVESWGEYITVACQISTLKGQCPDYAHARASSVFSSKDNRTVILTRQDFLPDRTADRGLLFTFSHIINSRRSLSSYLKFGSRHEDLPRFCYYQGLLATRKNSYRSL